MGHAPGRYGRTAARLFRRQHRRRRGAHRRRPRSDVVHAVVSRGGRPDLALDVLPRVTAPTLLIVGREDGAVVDLNREAAQAFGGAKEMRIVPGAGHLLEEPGDEVGRLACDWFGRHLVGHPFRDRAEAGRVLAARLARYAAATSEWDGPAERKRV